MTAPASPPPESPEPSPPERPRLLINGAPVRPEELGRNLSPAVLLMLSVSKEPYEPPAPVEPLRTRLDAIPSRTLAVVLVLLGLGTVALLLLAR